MFRLVARDAVIAVLVLSRVLQFSGKGRKSHPIIVVDPEHLVELLIADRIGTSRLDSPIIDPKRLLVRILAYSKFNGTLDVGADELGKRIRRLELRCIFEKIPKLGVPCLIAQLVDTLEVLAGGESGAIGKPSELDVGNPLHAARPCPMAGRNETRNGVPVHG